MAELAGRLRERVTLERWVGVADEFGGEAGAWTSEGVLWAEIASAGHGAGVEAERRVRRQRHRVRVRSAARVDLGCRLGWRGRVLAVLSVERDAGRPDWIELLVEERG